MKISEAFPSQFLKADDLNGQTVTVTIEAASFETIGQGAQKENKIVLSFVGKEKRFVLNKTNAGTIAKLHGDDTDKWAGKRITLAAREVEFQGEMVLAIRVSLQNPEAKKPAAVAAPVAADDDGGSVPF